ncbi:MAG: hypothetical protein HY877_05975, partial [Deltaproteobacteria bacterium]|nr:hypothetical protein [Deltaproteobacteria bacterium]
MHSFQDFLKSLKGKVPEITPEEAHRRADMDSKTVILDVREPEEWKEAHIPRAKHIPRGLLELKIENLFPDKTTPIICHCAGGTRSLLAAHSLKQLGYTNASSMAGGFKAWTALFPSPCPLPQGERETVSPPVAAGNHRVETTSSLTDSERTRYARHLNIPEVGEEGQLKLLKSKVLLIGAGGLGSHAGYYL